MSSGKKEDSNNYYFTVDYGGVLIWTEQVFGSFWTGKEGPHRPSQVLEMTGSLWPSPVHYLDYIRNFCDCQGFYLVAGFLSKVT